MWQGKIRGYFELLSNCSHPGADNLRNMEQNLSPALVNEARDHRAPHG